MRRSGRFVAVAIAGAMLFGAMSAGGPAMAKGPALPDGAGRIEVPGAAPDGSAMVVWTYRPKGLKRNRPVVIVMHGVKRNASDYRDNWIDAADKYRLLVVAPEMTKQQFPGGRGYNRGNMFAKDKTLQPRALWAWPVIEKVFDAVKAGSGATAGGYFIFGHSAGAQFVHRFALFGGKTRAKAVLSANAGWYTMPTFDTDFPYGLKGSPLDAARLKAAFGRPLILFLGDQDTNPNHKFLRRSTKANRQGAHRFARGHAFFKTAQEEARRLGAKFAWRLEVVPGVGHDNAGMTDAAARWIAGQAR